MKGADPVGTLECPPNWVLDESLQMCRPENPIDQAGDETAAPFKPTAKMERCIQDVKANLRKKNSKIDPKTAKSTAIAICRSRLKQ